MPDTPQNATFDPEHPERGWTIAIPEPFWVRHWLFWERPGCYTCRIKLRDRNEWELHWLMNHAG